MKDLTERQLIDELIRRNNERLENSQVHWTNHWRLQEHLYEAGKIIAEWDGREAELKRNPPTGLK